MLPTSMLNSTHSKSGFDAGTSTRKDRRFLPLTEEQRDNLYVSGHHIDTMLDPDVWWWLGMGFTSLGAFLYLWPG